jgi:PAS domain S-box-containing protein
MSQRVERTPEEQARDGRAAAVYGDSYASQRDGWSGLFFTAFRESRNAMVLLDSARHLVDANGASLKLLGYRREELMGRPFYEFVVGGPVASPSEWADALASQHFTGEAQMRAANGTAIGVQWAATVEIVTGHRRVLFVALNTSRWGPRFRRAETPAGEPELLSQREREIVELVALGSTGPEIAEELRIAHNTVRTHLRNAMAKSGARSRAHLVAKALAEGLAFENR